MFDVRDVFARVDKSIADSKKRNRRIKMSLIAVLITVSSAAHLYFIREVELKRPAFHPTVSSIRIYSPGTNCNSVSFNPLYDGNVLLITVGCDTYYTRRFSAVNGDECDPQLLFPCLITLDDGKVIDYTNIERTRILPGTTLSFEKED